MPMLKSTIHYSDCLKTLAATLSASSLMVAPALAQTEIADQDFYFRGFGSVLATKTSDANVAWRIQNQPIAQAKSKAGQWAFNAESLIGVQADFRPKENISGTIQLLAINRSRGEIDPDIELAFVRYKPSPQWQFRVGRIWTPSFLNSETRYIGFSNTTIRNTNYTLYQITNLNGGDVQFNTPFASGTVTATAYLGSNRYQLPDSASGKEDLFHLPMIAGGYLSWENEHWLLRSSATRIKLQRQSEANRNLIDSTVPALKAAFADDSCAICGAEAVKWERNWTGVTYDVLTAAARYSTQHLVVSTEYIRRSTNATIADAAGWDLDVAYTHLNWTPYANYLTIKSLSNNKPVFPSNLSQFSSLNVSYEGGHLDRTILTTGMKYAINKNTAVRGEIMAVRFADPKAQVGFAPVVVGAAGLPSLYHVFSVSFDFIF